MYDAINFDLLRSHSIPGQARRVSGADIDAEGSFAAKIVTFSSRSHTIMIRWGWRAVHIWNFGRPICSLAAPRRLSLDRTLPRLAKTEVSQNLREDLSSYDEERAERAEQGRLFSEFAVSGLSEAEMLQYAQMLSIAEDTSAPFAAGGGDAASGEDLGDAAPPLTSRSSQEEDDLHFAIQLSLADLQ